MSEIKCPYCDHYITIQVVLDNQGGEKNLKFQGINVGTEPTPCHHCYCRQTTGRIECCRCGDCRSHQIKSHQVSQAGEDTLSSEKVGGSA